MRTTNLISERGATTLENQSYNLEEGETDTSIFHIYTVRNSKMEQQLENKDQINLKPYNNHVFGYANSTKMYMLVDTGATISLISEKLRQRLNLPIIPLEKPVNTITATNENILIKGLCEIGN